MLLIGSAVLAQGEGSPRQVLDACIDSLDPTIVGLEGMEGACPGLTASIEQLNIAPLLPENQRSVLTRGGLINLRSLVERYELPPERGEVGIDGVKSVLDSLREPVQAERSQSWYERLKRWLRDAFSKQEDQANPWLRRWLDEHQMSDVVRLSLLYGVVGLVILLALLIVLNEVRASRAGRRKARAAGAATDSEARLAADSLDSVARGQRASALLRMLIGTLVKAGRLHSAQSLTHRELASRARFDDSAQGESFRRVARLAEREVFSGQQTTPEEMDDAVQAGRDLNARLTGAAT